MPFRSKKDAETKTDNSVDLLTSEEPVIAGRFEWVTTATRDQLADMAGRSKSLAGTARTRVTPLAEIPSKRFRASREQIVVAPEPEEKSSSTPWLLIAIIAAVASAIVAIMVQRARQRAVEEHEIDLLMEGDVLSPEQPLIHHHHQDYDNVAVNPS